MRRPEEYPPAPPPKWAKVKSKPKVGLGGWTDEGEISWIKDAKDKADREKRQREMLDSGEAVRWTNPKTGKTVIKVKAPGPMGKSKAKLKAHPKKAGGAPPYPPGGPSYVEPATPMSV